MRGYWKNVENSSFDNSNGRQVLLPNILVDILLQLFISWLFAYTVVIKNIGFHHFMKVKSSAQNDNNDLLI